LAEKLGDKGVKSFSLYPGRIETGIGKHLLLEEWIEAGISSFCFVFFLFSAPN
jgi:NAD(P)-dependent dehydrogenase (short-subunit alcohol dehydrogenase family)